MFSTLNSQRGEFGPDAVVAKWGEGLELAIRRLFGLFQGRCCRPTLAFPQAGKGALPPPSPGTGRGDKALREPPGNLPTKLPSLVVRG